MRWAEVLFFFRVVSDILQYRSYHSHKTSLFVLQERSRVCPPLSRPTKCVAQPALKLYQIINLLCAISPHPLQNQSDKSSTVFSHSFYSSPCKWKPRRWMEFYQCRLKMNPFTRSDVNLDKIMLYRGFTT